MKTKDPREILDAPVSELYSVLTTVLSRNLVAWREATEGDNTLAAGAIISAFCDLHSNGWTVAEIDALVAHCHREIQETFDARKRGIN